jgi:hypothetical protein
MLRFVKVEAFNGFLKNAASHPCQQNSIETKILRFSRVALETVLLNKARVFSKNDVNISFGTVDRLRSEILTVHFWSYERKIDLLYMSNKVD